MLSCRDVSALATEYAEGALPWGRRTQIRLHLAMCRLCRRYARQLEMTRRLLRRLPAPPLSDEARRKSLETFRSLHPAAPPASARDRGADEDPKV